MSIKLGMAALVCMFVFGVIPANGQQKGQYIPGQQGLNTGVLPDPGFTYANLTVNYSADTLRNANGNSVPLTGSYDIWAISSVPTLCEQNQLVIGNRLNFVADRLCK